MRKIFIIGIGYKPFDKKTKEILMDARIILASRRLFDVFRRYEEFETFKDKIEVINNVDATMNFIRMQGAGSEQGTLDVERRPVVILASGDPLFCGIGRRTMEEFGKDAVEIIPDLSSVQMAFARIKEPWDDAFLLSVHHGPDAQIRRKPKYGIRDIPSLLKEHRKIAILTDTVNNPSVIAETIVGSSGLPDFSTSPLTMFVCEKLGYPDERVVRGTPEEMAAAEFSEPNVVIIMGKPQP